MRYLKPMACLFAVLVLAAAVAAEETTQPSVTVSSESVSGKPGLTPSDKLAITNGTLTIAGKSLNYTATAGYMSLKDEAGKPRANVFFVAYTAGGTVKGQAAASGSLTLVSGQIGTATTIPAAAPAPAARPLMFVFNGGPGSAAVWLHLGAAGPKRIDIPADGTAPKAPYRLVDNDASWLPATDLVFVDPVSTGYSRPATPEQGKEFHGFHEDISSIGEFVRLYLTKNQRWDSPIFLAGESYGTTRAAGLAEHLQQNVGVNVSGVVLISTVLNFAMLAPHEGNDLPYLTYLPTYTAVAWYHGKIKGKREDLLKEAERFALNEYTVALAKGASLSEEDRGKAAGKIAELTGLTKEYVLACDLRIEPSRFEKELLRGDGKVVGRFDGRLTGWATDPANDSAEWDPSFDGFLTAYTSAMNEYARGTLKYENDLPYEVLTGKVNPWNYNSGGWSGYLYVGDNLRNAMTRNPNLKLLIAAGWYDLATPYFGVDYTANHLGLAKDLRKNITQTYYAGGHMVYHERTAAEQLERDVARMIESAVH